MQLLDKIKHAFAAVQKAETAVNEAAKAKRAKVVSRAKTLGLLLLDAHKRHPKVDDFKEFLRDVKGLHLSRAYDYMAVASNRTTVQQLRDQARERKQRSRKKKKSEQAPDSVTVTESPEQHKTENATGKGSAHYLAEFTVACRMYLPKITDEADRQTALALVVELTTLRAKAA
jgi:ABC-type Na+ efflux pump permease subunit